MFPVIWQKGFAFRGHFRSLSTQRYGCLCCRIYKHLIPAYSKPTNHKVFLPNYRKRKKTALKNYLPQPKTVFRNRRCSFRLLAGVPEKICISWVQTRGYQACVFCKLIPLRVCLSESAHLMQTFLKNLRPPQNTATSKFPSLSVSHNTNHFPLP